VWNVNILISVTISDHLTIVQNVCESGAITRYIKHIDTCPIFMPGRGVQLIIIIIIVVFNPQDLYFLGYKNNNKSYQLHRFENSNKPNTLLLLMQ